ncbi:hypothetical protein PROFUN_05073 [Planoprotostelium fungivorum]|uniref:PIG-P domain-containing protein n=1 Tax=Planoprotostelium fungivorum TaxID=1890364 RepID=A0A2P6NSC8_9EUKA|nr:hypothetical protein PROFUN_05073 [Planoprotostelium fungivorum]
MRLNEVYGFVWWIGTFVVYISWLVWAFLPERNLRQLGITYYPNKWWALCIPLQGFIAYGVAIVCYQALNFITTEPLDSFNTIQDDYTQDVEESKSLDGEDNIPTIADLPIVLVNDLLYWTPEEHDRTQRS